MVKKWLCLGLIMGLLLGVFPALAGTLDLTPVLESESLILQVDEAHDLAFISCDKALTVKERHFEHKYEHPRRWSYIASDIIIGSYSSENPYPVMQTWIYYEGTQFINADSATFRIDGREYTLTGIGSESRRGTDEGGVYETLGIIYGTETQDFLAALSDYEGALLAVGDYSGSVTVVLHGTEDLEITMNGKALMDLYIIGTVFSEINGFDYFSLITNATLVTVK